VINLLVAICAIYAASSNVDEKSLYGRWKSDAVHGVVEEIDYAADHSFRGDLIAKDVVVWKFAGTWSVECDKLRYVYTESSNLSVPPGFGDSDTIVEIKTGEFSIRTRTEEVHHYVRVK